LQSYVVDEDTEDALTGFQNHLESEKADVDDIRNNKDKSSNSNTNQESESSLLSTIISWIVLIAIVSFLLDSC
jgi:F0F1-type ATP synthase assembly protein I